MNFDSDFFGAERSVQDDETYNGSNYSAVRQALFQNRYYLKWGAPGQPGLPTYEVTLGRTLRGIWRKARWHFQNASDRTIASAADLRWGADGRGFRRLLHPNGVCLFGRWTIDQAAGTKYTGYFKAGMEGLVVARYSTCCTETHGGRYRSLALIGKLYPTLEPEHFGLLRPANFITQQDFGGELTEHINEAKMRNTPDTTPWRRGMDLPVLLLTGLVLLRSDRQPTARQLYPIAELGKPADVKTNAPAFMRLQVSQEQPVISEKGLDFREEILALIYDKGDPIPKRKLTFTIEVSDTGSSKGFLVQRQNVEESSWRKIGKLEFQEAVASYNGDFVFHAHHPPWRNDRNDPNSVARKHVLH